MISPICKKDQRISDIASYSHPLPFFLQHLPNEQGRRRLPIRPCYRNDRNVNKMTSQLDLTDDLDSLLQRPLYWLNLKVHPRTHHNHVLFEKGLSPMTSPFR